MSFDWSEATIAACSPLGWARLVTRNDPKPFTLPRHLRYLDGFLRKLDAGEIQNLLIQMPVQHGKSTACSVWFPAWYLCRHPEASVGIVSYSTDFAADKFGKVARDIVERAGMGWFGVTVDGSTHAKGLWSVAGHAGQLAAVGIDKGLTGRPADLLVIDDPLAGMEEAFSANHREMIWGKWQIEIATRLSPRAPKLFIMSRWMEDDFLGRLIRDMTERGEPFTLIDLPAIALEGDPLGRRVGEALWPEVRNIDFLLEQRGRMGTRAFDAQFQGRPRPDAGAVFRREWFRYYDVHMGVIKLFDSAGAVVATYPVHQARVFQMVDLATSAASTADYTVIGTFALLPRRELIVLDIVRDRIPGPQQLDVVRSLCAKWRPFKIGIEAVAYQLSFVQAAVQAGLPADALKRARGESKETRAYTAATRYEIGMVWHPRTAPWLGDFEAELISFPAGTYDDQVDVVSDAGTVVALAEHRDSGAIGTRIVGDNGSLRRGVTVGL
ncbi:MAG TPA: phage terminase large subunit [Candidatus Lustribacter sp.]